MAASPVLTKVAPTITVPADQALTPPTHLDDTVQPPASGTAPPTLSAARREGVIWPDKPNDKVVVEMLEASVHGIDIEGVQKDAKDMIQEKQWRKQYCRHFVNHVRACCTSADNALKISHQGLQYMHSNFKFVRNGISLPLLEAMQTPKPAYFAPIVINGTAKVCPFSMSIYGKVLTGEDAVLHAKNAWLPKGVIESSCLRAIEQAVQGEFASNLAGHTFVVLGAASAMGPFKVLLDMGATVVGLDINKPEVQEKIIAVARSSAGTLILPGRGKNIEALSALASAANNDAEMAKHTGCNILEDTPEVIDFLSQLTPTNRMTLGAYIYLDGARFVSGAIAQDVILTEVMKRRGKERVSLAFLCSPTDIFARPLAAREDALKRYSERPLWMRAAGMTGQLVANSLGDNPVVTKEGEKLDLVQCVISPQGPNYLMAKRIQHWRAMLARNEGVIVSSNVAPASDTISVKKSWILAHAYRGTRHFSPIEIFDPACTQAVMTAALLHDVFDPTSHANPSMTLAHPLQLFSYQAWHGGMWRAGANVPQSATIAALMSIAEGAIPKALRPTSKL